MVMDIKEFVKTYLGVGIYADSSGKNSFYIRGPNGNLDDSTIAKKDSESKIFTNIVTGNAGTSTYAFKGSFQSKSVGEFVYMMNSISTIDLSMAIPVFRMAFFPFVEDNDSAKRTAASIIDLHKKNVSNVADLYQQGNEIYLCPQHLWTKDKNSIFNSTGPIKPFVPLWSVENVGVEVAESEYGPIYYERVSVELTLYDVSRLAEIMPFFNPVYQTTVVVEYGWETLANKGSSISAAILSTTRKVVCKVMNYDIDISSNRTAKINLVMYSNAYDIVRDITISGEKATSKTPDAFKKLFDIADNQIKIPSVANRKRIADASESIGQGDIAKAQRQAAGTGAAAEAIGKIAETVTKNIGIAVETIFKEQINATIGEKLLQCLFIDSKSGNNASGVVKTEFQKLYQSSMKKKSYSFLCNIVHYMIDNFCAKLGEVKEPNKKSPIKPNKFTILFGYFNKYAGGLAGRNIASYIVEKSEFSDMLKRHLVASSKADVTMSDVLAVVESQLSDLSNVNYSFRSFLKKGKKPVEEGDLEGNKRQKFEDMLKKFGCTITIKNEKEQSEQIAIFKIPRIRYELLSSEKNNVMIVYDQVEADESMRLGNEDINNKLIAGSFSADVKEFIGLKNKIRTNYPYILVGSERSAVKSFSFKTQASEELESILMTKADASIQDGTIEGFTTTLQQMKGGNFVPMSMFPLDCELELIGCSFINFGQQIFIDAQTNTTADNIYTVIGVNHEIGPGGFTTKVSLRPTNSFTNYSQTPSAAKP